MNTSGTDSPAPRQAGAAAVASDFFTIGGLCTSQSLRMIRKTAPEDGIVTSQSLKTEALHDEYAELARSCAEAVRELRATPPNRSALNGVLARIDALLAEAQQQLAEAVHASQRLRAGSPGARALFAALEEAAALKPTTPVQWG